LPDLERRLLAAMALLRKPESPQFLRRLVDEPRVLAVLPELLRDLPEVVERTPAGWTLQESVRTGIAARLQPTELQAIHRRAAGLYLEQAGG
jgi:hypothetical protein